MPRERRTTPTARAADAEKRLTSIRRKHKVNTKTKKKLLEQEIPYVQDMVVILKLAGYSRTDIASVIGISRGQVADFLEEPEVQTKLVALRARIPAAAAELLQGFMIESVMTIMDVQRSSDDDAIRLKAAESVLDRGGVPKLSRQEKTIDETHREEHEINFNNDFMELIRRAPVEIQEQAAQMIEGLEALLKTNAEEVNELTD